MRTMLLIAALVSLALTACGGGSKSEDSAQCGQPSTQIIVSATAMDGALTIYAFDDGLPEDRVTEVLKLHPGAEISVTVEQRPCN